MQILAEAEDQPKAANIKTQLVSLWTAPVFGLVYLVAFVAFPGFFPPMSPQMTAEQVAAFYADNAAMIRFSMITYDLCGVMLLPLSEMVSRKVFQAGLPASGPFAQTLTLWVGLLGAAIAARQVELLTVATGEFLPKGWI